MEALAKFGRWCLDHLLEHIGDLDAGQVEDKAIELGLVTRSKVWGYLRETEAAKLEETQE